MSSLTGTVAFFDVGGTLASVALSPDGDRIADLAVYADVPEVLADLRRRGAWVGIVSDPGPVPHEEVDRALQDAGLGGLLDPDLVVYGAKDSPQVFETALARAGAVDRALFVGEDAAERAHALAAGLLVAPHPRLAVAVLEERARLRHLRVEVPAAGAGADPWVALRDLPLLPLHVTGPAGTTVLAIGTSSAAARLEERGFEVDPLGAEDEPLTTDLYLLRDDRRVDSGFLVPDGDPRPPSATAPAAPAVLAATDDGLLVAVPAGRSVEAFHGGATRHGHDLKLSPIAWPAGADDTGAGLAAAPATAVPATVTPAEQEVLDAGIRPEHLTTHLGRYTGTAPAGADGSLLTSRHVRHPDNRAAVTALVADLERIGRGRFLVRRHAFPHEGRRPENVEAEFPGRGLDGVVLVTAHMDSTGARQPDYRPEADPAPGADDDASGVAGVLAAAEVFGTLDGASGAPRRTVRFVLFNAEEQGLVGSSAYARDQARLGTPIVAVLQMDMIGWDSGSGRTFELHAGFSGSQAVQQRSLALARTIAALVPQVSPALPAPQLYPHDGEVDPGEARSDHHSFQAVGYPACLVSEDLFAGPGPSAPPADMNPQYHLPSDVSIDAGYAADIARLVTAAAWVTATR
ncbi:M28 family peptidase [Geodermatophilus normandii]|uniref:M28 family peptidase n=1 Tax=Geodermatophilus normandii TaxID=1137989 RepID=A0A6P0GFN4_9ACTN|nr:M28 family peptidase [Geodermatophilus normandii]NEM06069.1 M28 family peptidase [Geodermatophilus normandii]